VHEPRREHDEAGGAEAALQRPLLTEGGLHGMQLVPFGESFHRVDAAPLRLDREHEAGAHGLAV
jgi:hypothetical protein